MAAGLVCLCWAGQARADSAPALLLVPVEAAPGAPLLQPMRIQPFGPSPAPRVVLFPPMRIARPSDIPPPKPTKGLALTFDW
jgi:hypothetical protein